LDGQDDMVRDVLRKDEVWRGETTRKGLGGARGMFEGLVEYIVEEEEIQKQWITEDKVCGDA